MKKIALLTLAVFLPVFLQAQNRSADKFKQLYEEFPTPNSYRTAAGAPGHAYYQQRADYKISVELNDEKQSISGEETITYTNNSPDQLEYIWLQLDQNMRAENSMTAKTATASLDDKESFSTLERLHRKFDGGFKIEYVKDKSNNNLSYTVNNTMMRVDPAKPIKPGEKFVIKLKWWYNINDRMTMGGRSGYEYFAEDDNYLYTIAQFYPRMAVYNDVDGWQNKQFLGNGEFTLPFGDFEVEITVPSDHLVAATGELQNAAKILPKSKQDLLKKAASANEPVIIYNQDEAVSREKARAKDKKTWVFKATNVRDFGWASSRKFIWDAQGVKFGSRTVMAMSMYPKEGNPLWEQYSTRVIVHTLKVYSKYTFDYPYPAAWSIHADRIGMEYPMICFNFGRPEKDGTYSDRIKYGMIGVIIHEVGHNFFPMIVNSDERQWTWMDEGLNSFLEYLAEQEWEEGYPSRRGPAYSMVDYMKGDIDGLQPIMTNSESITQFGNNAYGKPAAALNILRETVMGRELFDYAFKTYSQRWMFKHPSPADFFRTMEDASAVDLDWFWRGWFYSNDYVDQDLAEVKWLRIDTKNPSVEKAISKMEFEKREKDISSIRNYDEKQIPKTAIEADAKAKDFYNTNDPYAVTSVDEADYDKYVKSLSESELALLNSGLNYYEIKLKNVGELVMPVILEFTFEDGTTAVERIPAEIWRKNDREVSKVFFFEKEVKSVVLDPFMEVADIDRNNNYWPQRMVPSRFELFKQRFGTGGENAMQRAKRAQN
ncbi:M1 family peptidase [bacterium]|nr:MAG: M1 family peptidase [bacterium]